MTEAAPLAPVAARQRLHALDVLRGIALLGIALMNVEYFGRPLADVGNGVDPSQTGLDHALSWLIYVFVQGKFWILFSLLFGMGFAVMGARTQAAGGGFTRLYVRRSLGLLVIGLVHALAIWAGDILVTYAIGALLLLLFRDASPRRQGQWGALLYGAPVLGLLMMAAVMLALQSSGLSSGDHVDLAQEAREQAARAAEIAAYSDGTWWQATVVRARYLLTHIPEMLVFECFAVGIFLIGAWLLRSGAIAQPSDHAALYRRLRHLALPVGVVLALLSAAVTVHLDWKEQGARAMLAMALMLAASPLLSLGYLALVVAALQTAFGARLLAPLAPLGRMALSNYLLQSLVGTWLFYGHGLGLWGSVPRRWQVAGVVAVFVLQVLLSRIWLAHFRHGPVEWLWRAWTYRQVPPMRAR
ncbi:DUF418 domain-containing protein [Lysobacter sp. S4-A87]|uniref:DUF418 domain-containing protein n=1 Tax=Lysobacter sp. S4-A87 TaxID=2925843 RepID=UPI001F53D86C|nr:DUF418 domain-containing protein [Lysobacter sp. S4-A87]UNK49307.1 DUF418 domain-containing protein [Lysobacter sp. S4-A87]